HHGGVVQHGRDREAGRAVQPRAGPLGGGMGIELIHAHAQREGQLLPAQLRLQVARHHARPEIGGRRLRHAVARRQVRQDALKAPKRVSGVLPSGPRMKSRGKVEMRRSVTSEWDARPALAYCQSRLRRLPVTRRAGARPGWYLSAWSNSSRCSVELTPKSRT